MRKAVAFQGWFFVFHRFLCLLSFPFQFLGSQNNGFQSHGRYLHAHMDTKTACICRAGCLCECADLSLSLCFSLPFQVDDILFASRFLAPGESTLYFPTSPAVFSSFPLFALDLRGNQSCCCRHDVTGLSSGTQNCNT